MQALNTNLSVPGNNNAIANEKHEADLEATQANANNFFKSPIVQGVSLAVGSVFLSLLALPLVKTVISNPGLLLNSLYASPNNAEKATAVAGELCETYRTLDKEVDALKRILENAELIEKSLYGDKLMKAVQGLVQNKDVWVNSKNWGAIEAFNKHLPVIEGALAKVITLQDAAKGLGSYITTTQAQGLVELCENFYAYLGYATRAESQLKPLYELFKSAKEIAAKAIKG